MKSVNVALNVWVQISMSIFEMSECFYQNILTLEWKIKAFQEFSTLYLPQLLYGFYNHYYTFKNKQFVLNYKRNCIKSGLIFYFLNLTLTYNDILN